jgi:hypothetical protein
LGAGAFGRTGRGYGDPKHQEVAGLDLTQPGYALDVTEEDSRCK